MNERILVIGDSDAPYHPLSNIVGLTDDLIEYNLSFSDCHNDLLLLSEFSLCISYLDSWECPLSLEQTTMLKQYLWKGGALLTIHNGISLQATPDLHEVLGAIFAHHPPAADLNFRPVARHPVTKGIETFSLFDEPYHYEFKDSVNLLLTYNFGNNTLPAAWENTYGAGRLIHLMPGHDQKIFQNPTYLRVIRNSIAYLIQR